jgi:hypothetical protein
LEEEDLGLRRYRSPLTPITRIYKTLDTPS